MESTELYRAMRNLETSGVKKQFILVHPHVEPGKIYLIILKEFKINEFFNKLIFENIPDFDKYDGCILIGRSIKNYLIEHWKKITGYDSIMNTNSYMGVPIYDIT